MFSARALQTSPSTTFTYTCTSGIITYETVLPVRRVSYSYMSSKSRLRKPAFSMRELKVVTLRSDLRGSTNESLYLLGVYGEPNACGARNLEDLVGVLGLVLSETCGYRYAGDSSGGRTTLIVPVLSLLSLLCIDESPAWASICLLRECILCLLRNLPSGEKRKDNAR